MFKYWFKIIGWCINYFFMYNNLWCRISLIWYIWFYYFSNIQSIPIRNIWIIKWSHWLLINVIKCVLYPLIIVWLSNNSKIFLLMIKWYIYFSILKTNTWLTLNICVWLLYNFFIILLIIRWILYLFLRYYWIIKYFF